MLIFILSVCGKCITCESVTHSGTDSHCTGAWAPGPGGRGQSCGIQQAWAWWEGGIQPAGSSAGVSQSPMPGSDRTNQGRAQASSMHANQAVRGARVEGICRGSLPWLQQQSHNITWAGKSCGRNVVSWHWLLEAPWLWVTSPLLRTVKRLQSEGAKDIDIFLLVDVWWVKHCFINDAIQNEIFSIVPSVQIGEKTRTLGLTKRRKQEHSVLKTGYCKRTRSSFQHNPISGF